MGRKREDLTGRRYGRLTVISYNEEVSKQKGRACWICKCDCGNEVIVRGEYLKSGATKSCGCYNRDKAKEQWQDKEFRQMKINKIKEQWKDEEFRQKQSNGTKELWQNEEYRQMQSNKMRELWKDEEYRQMQSNKMRELWKDEEYRQMQSNKMREIAKELWKDEEYRQMHKDIEHNYKGGISPISDYLRHLLVVSQWRKDTYIRENNRCQLTDKKVHGGNSDVHHLYGFNMIVLEAHELHNIQVKPQVKDYTEEELHKLEEYVTSWHKDTSNAVLLSKEVHDLFHSLYGYGNNTPEQYEEFKQRYLNGEFSDLLGDDLNV